MTSSSSDTAPARHSVTVTAFLVQLVLELCDRGTLREALDAGFFRLPTEASPQGGNKGTVTTPRCLTRH